ncbi:MAG: S8 family serine peptidase [Ardenticatenaceae bacterium]|nr:S8 family serine peptidase [Ardenticatenaceae bacterium]
MKIVKGIFVLSLLVIVLIVSQGSFALPPSQDGGYLGMDEDQLAAVEQWGSTEDPHVTAVLQAQADTAVTSTLSEVHLGYDKVTGQYLDDPTIERAASPQAVEPKANSDIDASVIRFGTNNALQVTPGMNAALREKLATAGAPAEYLVLQFTYPVDIALKEALVAQGVVFGDPLDKLSFYAKIPGGAVTAVSRAIDQGKINFVGQVPAAFHIGDGVQAQLNATASLDAGIPVTVQLFEAPSEAQLADLGNLMTIERRSDGTMHLVEGVLPAGNVLALAGNTAVQLIQEQVRNDSGSVETPPVPDSPSEGRANLEGNLSTGGDILKQNGYTGVDINVMVMDSGIAHQGSTYHPDLPLSRITDQYAWYPTVSTDPAAIDSHGTHVAGSIGGSGVGTTDLAWQGIAPDVNFMIYRLCCNAPFGYGYFDSDFQASLQRGASHNGHVSNNSWGGGNNTYAVSSQLADRAVRGEYSSRWMNMVIITHNDNALSRSPGTAKNAITVGAVKDGNWPNESVTSCGGVSDYDWPPGERICFSNYGPIDVDGDGASRIKPDLMAPGVKITSSVAWYLDGDYYAAWNGTSMAAPQVTGSVAQFLDAYPGYINWPEVVKAAFIASATNVGGTDTAHYGRGMINVYHATYDQSNISDVTFWTGSIAATGSVVTHTFTVPSGFSEVRVALTWADPVAGDGTDDVINDLDLRVYDGNGVLVGTSATSDDTVEYVKATSGAPGSWTIRVNGYSTSSAQAYGLSSVEVLRPADLSITSSINPGLGTFSGGTFYLYTTLSNSGFAAPGSYVRLQLPSTTDFTVEGARIYTDDGRSHYYDDTELMNDGGGTYWRVAVGETIANHARVVRWFIRYNGPTLTCPPSVSTFGTDAYFRDAGLLQFSDSATVQFESSACNYLPAIIK